MRNSYSGTRPAAIFGQKYVQSSGRQVDWDQIPDSFRQGAVKVTCGANATAADTTMSLTVPLGAVLAKGTVLDFGGGKFARLSAAYTGTGAEVSGITVDALVSNISDGDVAYVGGHGPKFVPACTVMQQLTNGKVIPMSLVTKTYGAVRTPKGTNTGNGVMTLAATPVVSGGQAGTYRVVFIEPTSNLGTFVVEDPAGVVIGEGVVGTVFSNQVAFTIADGATDFIAGDSFTIAVTQSDGSACAGLIITDATQGSLTDAATGYGMVVSGVVWENLLPDSVAGSLSAAYKAALQSCGQGFVFETYADNRA